MTPAYELARYLESEGFGEFGGNTEWSIHCSGEPEKPDNVVTLYDTGGLSPLAADGAVLKQPGVQVRVRTTDYMAGYELQERIAVLFLQDGQAATATTLERTIGTGRYVAINPIGDIVGIGRDGSGRQLLTANYQVIRQTVEA